MKKAKILLDVFLILTAIASSVLMMILTFVQVALERLFEKLDAYEAWVEKKTEAGQ